MKNLNWPQAAVIIVALALEGWAFWVDAEKSLWLVAVAGLVGFFITAIKRMAE